MAIPERQLPPFLKERDYFSGTKKCPFSLESDTISCEKRGPHPQVSHGRRDSFSHQNPPPHPRQQQSTRNTEHLFSVQKAVKKKIFLFKNFLLVPHKSLLPSPHGEPRNPSSPQVPSFSSNDSTVLLRESPLERASNSRSRLSSPGGSGGTIKPRARPALQPKGGHLPSCLVNQMGAGQRTLRGAGLHSVAGRAEGQSG